MLLNRIFKKGNDDNKDLVSEYDVKETIEQMKKLFHTLKLTKVKDSVVTPETIMLSEANYSQLIPNLKCRVIIAKDSLDPEQFPWEKHLEYIAEKVVLDESNLALACKCNNRVEFPPHFHETKETIYLATGSFTDTISRRTYHAPEVVTIAPYSIHTFLAKECICLIVLENDNSLIYTSEGILNLVRSFNQAIDTQDSKDIDENID